MATDITFGIKTDPVATTKVDSGALGNTSNSTSSGATSASLDTGAKQTLQDQLAIAANDKVNGVSLSSGTSTTTQPVTTSADTNQLESSTNTNVSLPNPTEPQKIDVSSALDKITAQAGAIQNTLDQNKEQYDLQATQAKASKDLNKAFDSLSSLGKFESGVADSVELQKKKELKTEIDNKIMRKSRDFDLALRAAEDTFGTRAQKKAVKAEITKNYNRELADLSIIQMARAGEYNDAKAYVDQKVQLELQDRQNNLNKLMFFYQENKERLSLLDQRAFQAKIVQEERAYQEEYATKKRLEDIKATMTINAAEDGAGNAALQAIQGADSLTSLMSLPNSGRWSKSKADRLSEQLASINVAKASQALNGSTIQQSGGFLTSLGAYIPNKELTADQQKKVDSLLGGIQLVDQVEELYNNAVGEEYQGAGSGILARLKGVGRQTTQIAGLNQNQTIYENFLSSNRAPIAKGIKGETGNLTEAEQKQALKAFPSQFSSPKEAAAAFENIREQMKGQMSLYGTVIDTGASNSTESPDDYLNRVDTALQTGVYGNYLK